MQSVTKNGIMIEFPDDIEPGKSYAITYTVRPSFVLTDTVTDFWIITQSGRKVKFTIKQLGNKSLS